MIGSKVLLYTVLPEVEEVVPMVGEEVEEVEEVGLKVARQVVLKVEEVVEEVVRKVGAVAPPDFRLLVLHEMVLHQKVVLCKGVLPPVVLPPVVLLRGVLRVEEVVEEEAWVELLLGLKYFE